MHVNPCTGRNIAKGLLWVLEGSPLNANYVPLNPLCAFFQRNSSPSTACSLAFYLSYNIVSKSVRACSTVEFMLLNDGNALSMLARHSCLLLINGASAFVRSSAAEVYVHFT